MSASFLEIVQLPNGEIVLQRTDTDEVGEPLINIRFSDESKAYMGEAGLDIAKIMIQAGIQAAAQLEYPADSEEGGAEKKGQGDEPRVLH